MAGLALFAKIGVDYNVVGFREVNPTCSNCANSPNSAFAYLPVYGAGVEYDFKDIGLRAKWDYSSTITGSNDGASQISVSSTRYLLSLLYHF